MQITFAIQFPADEAYAEIRDVLADSLKAAIDFMEKNFQSLIIDQLIFGGKGWKALVDTPSWKWLNSPKGFAQMGFSSALEPLKLLTALRFSWKFQPEFRFNKSAGSMYVGFKFQWANIDALRKATIHPAAGQLNLPADRSWFDWIYSGIALQEVNYHFKKTGPRKGVRSSIIAGAEAGLMKKGGLWQVTPRFRLDLDALLARNEDKIAKTIETFIQAVVTDEVAK